MSCILQKKTNSSFMLYHNQMKREILLGGKKVSYTIRVSNRARYMRLTVGITEGLIVTIPSRWHERFIEGFLRQKSSWILRQLEKVSKMEGKIIIKHSKREYEANKQKVLSLITTRLQFFNSLYKHTYHRVSVRNQTSLWGSCTRSGNLQFNYKLMYLPPRSIDYVIVHELCHLKEHNHSERFWRLVARMIPDYKAIRKSLHQYVMQEG